MASTLLAGRTAVVTGAAGDIGLAIATRLAEHGADVALIDLDADRTAAAARGIEEATGRRIIGVAADVSDAGRMRAAADEIEAVLGSVDVVVPNAGILVIKSAIEMSPAEFEAVLRVNLVGAFVTATEFARRMPQGGADGRIIFTSSIFGLRGGVGNAAYAASKFGLHGLAQSMAAELAPRGTRVNSVCPGQIDTVMLGHLFDERALANGTTPDAERAAFVKHVPLGGLGATADVADTYVYLASPLSSYVTGQHVVVDGGWAVGSA